MDAMEVHAKEDTKWDALPNTKVEAKIDATFYAKEDVKMDAKLEENVGTIVSTKHGTNCVTTKVDVMIDTKKEVNEDEK